MIPPWEGGATGSVWYTTAGPPLVIKLRAAGLVPGLRYHLDLAVPGAVYAVAGLVADTAGRIAFDTTLDSLADGVCARDAYAPPRSLHDALSIRFWVQRDGSPRSGTEPGSPPAGAGAVLPCRGNGDGIFTYALLEERVAAYRGGGRAPLSTATRRANFDDP